MITAITPTRDRPAAFYLCAKWMTDQTIRKDIQWIVVDDGDIRIIPPPGCYYVRRNSSGNKNTLALNLMAALERQTGDKIIIFEDDDYYSPEYCQEMDARLGGADATGEMMARYYNVKSRRWNVSGIPGLASLCRTAFRKECVPLFKDAIEKTLRAGDVSIDRRFWELLKESGKNVDLFSEPKICVSIKGLPGRPGLGRNHGDTAFPNIDSEGKVLESWIGKEAAQSYWSLWLS